MPVFAHTAEEQVESAGRLDGLLIGLAFRCRVGGVPVEDVDVLRRLVDVVEQVLVHEAVVALGMVLGKPHVFIHIERDHVLEGNLSRLDHADEFGIGLDGGGSGAKSEHEGYSGLPGRLFVDFCGDMVCRPQGAFGGGVSDNYIHLSVFFRFRNKSGMTQVQKYDAGSINAEV